MCLLAAAFPYLSTDLVYFVNKKPFFKVFCLISTFKSRNDFLEMTWIRNKEDSWWINRSFFLIKVWEKQAAAYCLPFSPTAEKAEQSYQVRSFCMAVLQFLSHLSLMHRGSH